MLNRTENTNSKEKESAVTLSRAEKIQMSVSAVILVAAISGLLYFVYAMPTVIKVVPLQQAHENVAAAQRALILEQKLLQEEEEARRQQQEAAGPAGEKAASPGVENGKEEKASMNAGTPAADPAASAPPASGDAPADPAAGQQASEPAVSPEADGQKPEPASEVR
ncbi:MAG: hypothetical protein IK129_03155 [Deltaproteobacteria bacterium]|nr:hypothetical protein [Deltaproteobacteria bacterium]